MIYIAFTVELQDKVQHSPPPSGIDSTRTEAVLESSIVSPQTSSLLIPSSKRQSISEGTYILFYDVTLCVLLEYFTDRSVNSGNSMKLPVMEDELSSLNLASSECQEEAVGSPKKKQKHDDAGTKIII